jgi:hypothetical protein
MHVAGATYEVVSEQLVTAYGKSASGKPISYQYTAVTVRAKPEQVELL